MIIRNLIQSFSKNLKISQLSKYSVGKSVCAINTRSNHYTSSNVDDEVSGNTNPINLKEPNYLDNDEYVSVNSYPKQLYHPQRQLIKKLKITPIQYEKLLEIDPKLKNEINRFNLASVIEIILEHGISKESILENPFILRMNADNLKQKINKLKLIKYKDINDVVPLLHISVQRLSKIAEISRKDSNILKTLDNRIYYISEKLNIEPKIISKYFSKRLFMFWMQLNTLIDILNIMLEYGIEPMNILKDLWAFRYPLDCVRDRLERANTAKKIKMMPWMVRCPEKIFQRSIKLSLDEQQLLGEKNSIVDYLSQRLGFDTELMKTIMLRHPAVFRVRIKKVKEVLDYLLNEAGFSEHEIARVPRVLCHKLETTKSRLEELKSHGCIPSSLVIVCRSKREYEKFLRNWIKIENKIKNKGNVGSI